jgi:hypothetical protein
VKVCGDAKQHGLEGQQNLQLVHADALPWNWYMLTSRSRLNSFILYPNPEPHNPLHSAG